MKRKNREELSEDGRRPRREKRLVVGTMGINSEQGDKEKGRKEREAGL